MKNFTIPFKTLFLAVATLLTISATMATPANNPILDAPVELRYVGSTNQLPVYQLNLNNQTKGSYLVSIKDESGELLYNEKISGSKITRNYQFDTTLPEGAKVTFEVTDLKNNSLKVYTLKKTTKIVEDFVVNEIK